MAVNRIFVETKEAGDELSSEEFNLIPGKLNELVDAVNTQAESIETMESGLSGMGGRVSSIESAQGSLSQRVSTLEQNAGGSGSGSGSGSIDLSGIERDIASLDTRVSALEESAIPGGVTSRLSELAQSLSEKVGDITYESGSLVLWDEPGGRRLGQVSLSGTVYTVRLDGGPSSVFYVLTSEDTHYLSISPVTLSGVLGGEMAAFVEDYVWQLAVDNGSGTFRVVRSGTCPSGGRIREDIRGSLAVGSNRVRLTVTGEDSGQVKTQIWTVNVTTLTLDCQFSWWKAWVEGSQNVINGLFFSGNMQKTLHVVVDDDDEQTYTQSFTANASYTTSAYQLDMSSRFPSGGTGIHKVELWLSGDGVETAHYVYRVMCVSATDAGSAMLVCVNNVAVRAVNYSEQVLFEYATYNATSVSVSIQVSDGQTVHVVVDGQSTAVETETRHQYRTQLEVDTETLEGLLLAGTVSVGGSGASACTEQIEMGVDNSNSYAATSGATFYLNAARKSNGSADREVIDNMAPGAAVPSYSAVWNGFAWSTDGWGSDGDGNRCLVVPAGSTVVADGLRPLAATSTQSVTIEMKVRVDGVADYDTPVLSLMDTSAYDVSRTCGIILFPTKLLMLTSTEREVTPQSVNLGEDRVLHLVVVLQRQYSTTGRNLCRIYVNGIQNAVFEYAGNAGFGNGCLRMGQTSSDLYLYMFRYYAGRALEHRDVLANLLNVLTEDAGHTRASVRTSNDIVDGGSISYELCRQKGYNCMVIETAGDVPVPSLSYQTKSKSKVSLEYGDHPDWNVTWENTDMDGQGTTSMRYRRWNLRWKKAKTAVWTYADGTSETGSGGYIAGRGLHPRVEKITAKKNYASSQQGHKIGATALYDELYERLGLKQGLPSRQNRVAVYQYPVMGFHKHQDGSYEFIGLYTIGPDKGDRNTFGYDTSVYPRLLSLEGPNHAPLGTRFLHPWTDMDYDPGQETMTLGGEEAWDVDVCAYTTDDADDKANIKTLLEQEWKPAYDIVYYCSPYLRSLSEVGMTLSELNQDPETWRNRMDVLANRKNEVLQLYDGSYNLIYYRTETGQYEVLSGYDMLEYLSQYLASASPTTAELVAARTAKFRAEAGSFWSIDDACYHDCYCELVGASDNDAKNSYPFKFRPLSQGGRWCWREDDLDTVLATDNNGQLTKGYSIEKGDVTGDGTDIFQGSSSAFWTLVQTVFQSEKRTMMGRIVGTLAELSRETGVAGAYVHESMINILGHYFFGSSAQYFPVTAYNEDAEWSYVYAWSQAPSATYNGVPPLTQALGDQHEAELLWIERRVVYILSLYGLGGFTSSSDDGMGRLEFTPAETFTFSLVPAIDMYPCGNRGGGDDVRGARTRAGGTCQITATSDGSTTYYLKALDYLTSIGDLSGLLLTSRGGDASIGVSLSVSGKRLRELKVGDANAQRVRFNAASLSVSGRSLEVVDARNVETLRNNVSLLGCPRLKRALFCGTNVPTLLIAPGSKVTEVGFPSGLQTLMLHSLPLLTSAGLDIPASALTTITGIYYNECPQLSPFAILRRIWQTEGNRLQFVTMIWTTPVSGSSDDLDMLSALAGQTYDIETGQGYGALEYDAATGLLSNAASRPRLEGTVNVNGNVYEDAVETLRNYFGAALTLNIRGQYYIRFADSTAQQLCATAFGDGTGLTRAQAMAVSTMGSTFRGNTEIASFDEFVYFSALASGTSETLNGTTVSGVSLQETFAGCTALVHIAFPPVSFLYGNLNGWNNRSPISGCSALTHVEWGQAHPLYTHGLFQNCRVINYYDGILPQGLTAIGNGVFSGCWALSRMIFYEGICTFGESVFQACTSLRYIEYPSTATSISLVSLTRDAYTGGIHIVIKAAVPPACTTGGYNRTMYFYVPDGSVDDYKAANGWSNYAANIKPLSELAQEYRSMGTVV